MVTVYDVEPNSYIDALKEKLKSIESLKQPEWSKFVKTGIHKIRPPSQPDFWYIRAASIMRNLYIHNAKGVQRLRTKYGGRKDRGARQEKFVKGAGKIIRTILQQLEESGLVEKVPRRGRKLTPKGIKLMDNVAYSVYSNGKK